MRISACAQEGLGSSCNTTTTLSDWMHQAKEWARQVVAQTVTFKNAAGEALFDLPLVLGIIAAVVKPHLALLAAIVLLATHSSIVVETRQA